MKTGQDSFLKLFLLMLPVMLLATVTAGMAGEARLYETGGFVFKQNQDKSWAAGMPECLGDGFAEVQDVQPAAGDSHFTVKVKSMTLPWKFGVADEDVELVSRVDGADISIDLKGMGTMAGTPNLAVYKDQSLAVDQNASFLSGVAGKSLPAPTGAKIVGMCMATARVKLKAEDDTHPLVTMNGNDTLFSYVTVQYIDPDADKGKTIGSVDDLREKVKIHTITFVGIRIDLDDNLTRILECRIRDNAAPQYLDGKTVQLTIGDKTIKARSLDNPAVGTIRSVSIPVEELNSIVDLGLKDNLVGVMMSAPGGTVLVAELPGGFSLPIPGVSEKLSFGASRITFSLGKKQNGSAKSIAIETILNNPSILFGSLGDNIQGGKKLSISIEGKTIVLNFHNSLEDLKPLGFSLRSPTVAINLDRKSINLSGNIQFPDDFPLPLANAGDGIDVAGEIGKHGVRFALVTSIEISLFDDNFRLGISTLVMGMANKKAYFAGVGTARLTKELSLLEGLDILKDKGLDLKVGMELTARVFVQTDGTFYVELSTGKLLGIEAGPIKSDLKDIKIILRRDGSSGKFVASIGGTTSIALDAGPIKINATTSASISTDGKLVVEIPQDPENPTGIKIGDAVSITIDHGKLTVDPKAKPMITIDATVSLTLADNVPVIGGQPLTGHAAIASDGSFVFEAVRFPTIKWNGMEFGLNELYVKNLMEGGQLKLSAGIGGGIKFLDNFPLEPLRGNQVGMAASISSSPLRVKIAVKGPWRFTIPHPEGGNTDFTFVFNELAIAAGQGGISASGTGGVEIKYPTSKYFLVGLPAALAHKDIGPALKLGVTITIAQNYIYFETAKDWDAPEIPVDVPGVVKGLTIQVNSLGGGIMWMANPPFILPLGDISARVCLPDLNGNGEFNTPVLNRPYDSYLGFTLAMTMQKPFMAAFDISKEHPPSIKIGDVVELDMRELGISTWLNATSIDVAGKLRVGHPEKGFGFLFDLLPPSGQEDNGHLCIFPAGPIMLPIPFHRRMNIHTNLAGFETRLSSEFPRPAIGTADMMAYLPLFIKVIKTGDFQLVLDELQNPCPGTQREGKLHGVIPTYKLSNAYIVFPKPLNDVFTSLPQTKDGRRKLTLFPKIDIDPSRAIPPLMQAWDVIRDPKTLPSKLVQFVPPEKRKGDFHVRFLGLVEGDLAYRLEVAGIKYEKERVRHLKAILDAADVARQLQGKIPELKQQAFVVKLKDGKNVKVSGTTIIDLPTEAGKAIKCIRERNLPANVRKSPRSMFCHLWKQSASHASRTRIVGDKIVFNRTKSVSKYDTYKIKVELTNSYGIPMNNGTAPGPNLRLSGGGYGVKARLAGRFPAHIRRTAVYPTPWGWRHTSYDLRGAFQTYGNGGLRLKIWPRRTSRTWINFVWFNIYEPAQNCLLDHAHKRRRTLYYPVVDNRGWQGRELILRDFNLNMKPSRHTSLNISKWGTATASIAHGQVVLRTMLRNSPASEARKLCDMLITLGLGELPTIDQRMARVWKRLWSSRVGGPRNSGNRVYLTLKNGFTACVYRPTLTHRYITKEAYIHHYRWVKKRRGWFTYWKPVPVWRTRNRYVLGSVTHVRARASGDLQTAHYSGKWWRYNGWQTMFSPRRYPNEKRIKRMSQFPGLVSRSRNKHHPGLVSSSSNRFGIAIARRSGWRAYTNGKHVWISTPDRKTIRMVCDSQLEAKLDGFGLSGEARDGYVFGEPGTYMVSTSSNTGAAKNVDEIVTIAGSKKLSLPRTISWKGGHATLQSNGTITGIYGLKSRSGSMSQTTLKGMKTGRSYIVKVSRGVTQVLRSNKGVTSPLRLFTRGDQRGMVQYQVSNNVADGLIVDGRLALGTRRTIRGETQFHGEIYSDGRFDLRGAAKIWVLSHQLAKGKVRLSSADGFFVQGQLNVPLIKANMTGTIQRRYFCFNGNFDSRFKGTGLVGTATIDPKGINASGKFYLLNKLLSRGRIQIGKGYVKAKFSARVGGKFTVNLGLVKPTIKWAAGYNVQATMREKPGSKLPAVSLRVCLWIDAPWPVGYRSLVFTIQTANSLEIRGKLGPVTIIVNLSNFSIRAKL